MTGLTQLHKPIYTYALIKSLYDEGEDYIDSFWPFTIKVLPIDGKFADLNIIQGIVKKDFDLQIPLYTLSAILRRAKVRNYVEQEGTRYRLTDDGLRYLDSFETEDEVGRRLNALLDDMKQFLDERLRTPTGVDQIHEALTSLLCKNIEPLVEFFNPSGPAAGPVVSMKVTTNFKKRLIEYIETAMERKPEHYKTLQDMFFGSIISTVVNSRSPSGITQIRAKRIKHCQVFLDTNFAFSVLGLDTSEFNEPAKELFSLLKEGGFQLKVFSFTVDEMCRVVNGYPGKEHCYPTSFTVDTLYSSLKTKGWKKTDAVEFIATLEQKLSEIGLQIEWVKEVDLENYNPPNGELRNLMAQYQYKPNQRPFYQNHDLAAIEKVKELRGHPVRSIESSKVCFLTSDKRLGTFNFVEMGHRANGTICEVILDSLLTSILWLKDPTAEISLKSMVAAYARDLFVKRRVWERFYETLRRVKQERGISDEAISKLFYHNYIEESLREFDDTQIDRITPEFVLEEIERAAKCEEGEVQEREKEFLQRLEEEVSEKERQKNREWLEKLQGIKSNIRKVAEKAATKRSAIYASATTLAALAAMYGMYLGLKKLGAPDVPLWLIPLLVGSGGMGGIWGKLRQTFRSKLSTSIYLKKLAELQRAGVEIE